MAILLEGLEGERLDLLLALEGVARVGDQSIDVHAERQNHDGNDGPHHDRLRFHRLGLAFSTAVGCERPPVVAHAA